MDENDLVLFPLYGRGLLAAAKTQPWMIELDEFGTGIWLKRSDLPALHQWLQYIRHYADRALTYTEQAKVHYSN